MGMTVTEKILACHAGLKETRPGDIISARVDLVLANELSAALSIEEFKTIKGAKRLFDPRKVVVVPDHFVPNKDLATAALAKKVREFALEHGAVYFEVGRAGIEHVVLPEKGLVVAGDLVVGGDSHTCTYGALAAFATGVGSADVAAAWSLGEVWLKVPATIRLEYRGELKPWVGGKDLILHTIGLLGVEGARYQALEFTGDGVAQLPMSGRLTMANMAVEAGAKSGIFEADATALDYMARAGRRTPRVYRSDPDASYAGVVEIDVGKIEPQVARPPLPENALPVSEVNHVEIDQVVIGSCTNGRLEDLREAAAVLAGRKVHPRVRCIVIPGSQKVFLEAAMEGLLQTFVESECVVSAPTCGPCLGGHMGVLAEGERCVSTTNRNFVGRMGAKTSEVWLAGPAVAAASAVAGRVASPEEVLG